MFCRLIGDTIRKRARTTISFFPSRESERGARVLLGAPLSSRENYMLLSIQYTTTTLYDDGNYALRHVVLPTCQLCILIPFLGRRSFVIALCSTTTRFLLQQFSISHTRDLCFFVLRESRSDLTEQFRNENKHWQLTDLSNNEA